MKSSWKLVMYSSQTLTKQGISSFGMGTVMTIATGLFHVLDNRLERLVFGKEATKGPSRVLVLKGCLGVALCIGCLLILLMAPGLLGQTLHVLIFLPVLTLLLGLMIYFAKKTGDFVLSNKKDTE
ncbi:hypothetical protein [Algirhabdus cladophorae]|uniref:hypothetical protein n=1 Tax=Algirhabdus cladophorae TaxID=3377108 RepID=UPI003B84617E